MKTKIILGIFLAAAFLAIAAFAGSVYATSGNQGQGQDQENKPDAAASLAKKKERAIQEIDRRIASLNTQIERINSAKRLTAG
ncbi:MAG: hypothetical protein PHC61_03355, partial [Chitinivibrionales bacterium]|nr:hypothetical protein [Chitinivibrionales bacterium]